MTGVVKRKRRGRFGHRFQIPTTVRDIETHRVECHMKMEAEIGVVQPHKDYQGPSEESFFSRSFQRSMVLLKP